MSHKLQQTLSIYILFPLHFIIHVIHVFKWNSVKLARDNCIKEANIHEMFICFFYVLMNNSYHLEKSMTEVLVIHLLHTYYSCSPDLLSFEKPSWTSIYGAVSFFSILP